MDVTVVGKEVIDLPKDETPSSGDYFLAQDENGGSKAIDYANLEDSIIGSVATREFEFSTREKSTLIDAIEDIDGSIGEIPEIKQSVSSVAGNVAEEFSASKAYAVGDYVLRDGQLYCFTTAHPAGAWNAAHVQAATVADAVTNLKDDLNEIDALTDEIKEALLACFEHTAWINENGQEYYNTLYNALYRIEEFTWDWTSGSLPEGMTADSYSSRSDMQALLIYRPNMQFGELGDYEIEIECRAYIWDGTGQKYGSSPQIVISTGDQKGIKIVAEYGNETSNPSHCYALIVDGAQATILDEIRCNEFHTIIMKAENGEYSLKIDGNIISIPEPSGTSQYFTMTGIASTSFQDNRTARLLLRSLKYKPL